MASLRMSLTDQMQDFRDWGARRRRLPSGLEIPAVAVPVFALGAVIVPAYGTQVVLVQHQVPANYRAVFCGIVLGYAGAPAPTPGDIIYSVDIDRPLGYTSMFGYDEKDFGSIPIQLGSLQFTPWPIEFKHSSSETIRIKGTPIANVGTGNPNNLLAALIGFEWPAERENA